MGFRSSQPGEGKGREGASERASEPPCAKATAGRERKSPGFTAFPERGEGGESFPTNLRPVSAEALQTPAFPPADSSTSSQAGPPAPGRASPSPHLRLSHRAEGPRQVLCWCVSSLCLVVETSLPSPNPLPAHPPGPQSRPWRREAGAEAGLTTGLGKCCQKRDRGNFLWGGGFVCV